jgi:hypothetical protein
MQNNSAYTNNDSDHRNSGFGYPANLRNPYALGIFFIGLAILLYTGWWWPGIMPVLGISLCVEFATRGRLAQGLGFLLLFLAIPTAVYAATWGLLPWQLIGPGALVAVGVGYLIKASATARRG